jgi:O-antigen/teichoic acid export membrane protein
MLSKNTTFTIGSKFAILLTNFLLVVFSTRIWGSEGRGEIALVLANVSIIAIFSNVFCGSSIAFHAPRQQRDFLLLIAFSGAVVISLSGATIFSALFGFRYFFPLFLIAFFMSAITAISSYWLGKNNIKNYNIITILSQISVLISLVVIYFIFNKTVLESYFHAYYIGTGLVLIIGVSGLLIAKPFKVPEEKFSEIRKIFSYGVNNEFNYLIQFLNYRLAYYFIAKMSGLSVLGVFSVVVSITEAVWIISRSMSAVHFSNVINSDDKLKNRTETMIFLKQSFWISSLFIIIMISVPETFYRFVFGNDFGDVKRYIIYLIPGIISIAVSNLYGHYFAGTGKLKILRNKSLIGLAATLILLPVLIKKYQLTGVCITLNVSYIISSFYLWFNFRKEGQQLQPKIIE